MTTYHHQFEANPQHRIAVMSKQPPTLAQDRERARLIATPHMRTELIARVQRELQLGVYENETRVDVTVEKLMNH